MSNLGDAVNTIHNNKKYTIIRVAYKSKYIPVVMDTDIYERVKRNNLKWHVSQSSTLHTLYTLIKDNTLYLHEIVFYLKNGRKNNRPLIHLNKVGLDNRCDNIIEDSCNKIIRKNLNKKARTIKLKSIDTSNIPSFVWYLKKDASHGERFQVELGNIKWKSTSSDRLSLHYKLEETKKYLRQYKEYNPSQFRENSMNSDLNEAGVKLKKQFYDILKAVNLNYDYSINSNTDELLKEDTSKLCKLERKLLSEFSINSSQTTYDRLKKI